MKLRLIFFLLILILTLTSILFFKLWISISIIGYSVLIPFNFINIFFFFFLFFTVLYFLRRGIAQKKEKRDREAIFTSEFFKSLYDIDRALSTIERYRNRSVIAGAISNEKVNTVDLVTEILRAYRQRKIKRFVDYEVRIGKGYLAIGAVIRHLIAHKKIPRRQSYFLERELKHYMPKEDIIGKFYERV